MGRGGGSPLGSGARTIPVKAVVVGRATAESPGAGRVPGEGGPTLLGEDLPEQHEGIGRPPGVLALRVLRTGSDQVAERQVRPGGRGTVLRQDPIESPELADRSAASRKAPLCGEPRSGIE